MCFSLTLTRSSKSLTLQTFDFGADDEEEMDEAYSTMSSNERDALQQQLRILQYVRCFLPLASLRYATLGHADTDKSR